MRLRRRVAELEARIAAPEHPERSNWTAPPDAPHIPSDPVDVDARWNEAVDRYRHNNDEFGVYL